MYLYMACDRHTHKHLLSGTNTERAGGGGGYSRNFRIGVCRKGSQNPESVSVRMKKTQIDSISRNKSEKGHPVQEKNKK